LFLGLYLKDFRFADCFFKKIHDTFAVSIIAKGIMGVSCFSEKLLILGLFFKICLSAFLLNFLADILFY